MLDMELFILLKATIEAAMPDYGIENKIDGSPGILVAQSYQPQQQGVAIEPTAYIEIVSSTRVGMTGKEDYYDEDEEAEIHRETQVMITTFQLSALATQSPTSTTQYTAEDIVNLIAMILQNATTIATLEAAGCGILLGRTTRNPKFIDDRGRFEASPSLDFGITHKLIVTKVVPVLQSQELQIISV
jgi:hypothetical protein